MLGEMCCLGSAGVVEALVVTVTLPSRCLMGQGLGRLARSRRVQLTPIPQADGKQCAAAEQKCMAGRTPELLYRQVSGWLEVC